MQVLHGIRTYRETIEWPTEYVSDVEKLIIALLTTKDAFRIIDWSKNILSASDKASSKRG